MNTVKFFFLNNQKLLITEREHLHKNENLLFYE